MARTKKEKAQAVVGIADKLGIKTSEFGSSALLIGFLTTQNTLTGDIKYAYVAAAISIAYIINRSVLKIIEAIKEK